MNTHPTIIEVIRRSEQGVTLPFFCKCDDGRHYWAKGACVGKYALCAEWVSACIARDMNLPIPNFKQLSVPTELVNNSFMEDINDLGEGIVFGSENIPNAQELSFSEVKKTPSEVMAKTLLFDWWVQNDDRYTSNPNIIFSISMKKAFIIDHNRAFAQDMNLSDINKKHVFNSKIDYVFKELFISEKPFMRNIIDNNLSKYYEQIPEEWIYQDKYYSISSGFTYDVAKNILNKVGNN